MRYVLIYGLIAGAVVVGVITAGIVFDLPSHSHSLWFGYLVMLLGMSLTFVGVKRYRDNECGGSISFGRALAVGLGIAAVAGVVYALGWEAYVALSGIDFMADYTAATLRDMRAAGASAAQLAAQEAELRGMAEMYRNPLVRISMTFMEIFPVGVLVALVSAVLLRNPSVLPARV